MTIHYKTGDATRPDEKYSVLVHCCNNIGRWGSGFVRAIDKTFGTYIGDAYRKDQWHYLGKVFFVPVKPDVDSNVQYVVNLIGQAGVINVNNPKPVQYEAIREGLGRVDQILLDRETYFGMDEVPVVMPRIGCGLAGGSWTEIRTIIGNVMPNRNVYVYDLPHSVEGRDWNP